MIATTAISGPEAVRDGGAIPADIGGRPRTVGVLGTLLLHGAAITGVLAWQTAPTRPPDPIVVELIAVSPPSAAPTPEEAVTPAEVAPEHAAIAEPKPEPVVEPEPAPEPPPPEVVATPDPPPREPPPPRPAPKPAPRAKPAPAQAARTVAQPTAPLAEQAPADTRLAGPAMAAPAPAAPVIAPPAEDAAYLATLLRHLERHRDYPRGARLRRIEGRAIVQLALARDGRVLEARVEQSSGHDVLDAAALDTVRRAAPLPPTPPELAGDRIILRVPFVYRLNPTPE